MIKVAKLVSQEFVIGRYIDNLLTNVALINFTTNPVTGESGVKVVPYMSPIVQSFAKIITYDKIIYMEDAPQQLQASYLEMIKLILEKIKAEQEKQKDQETQNGSDGVSENN